MDNPREDVITWDVGMAVHVEFLDRQHQKIIRIINENCRSETPSTSGGIAEALNELSHYAEAHLLAEEAFLRQHAFPGYVEHLAEHNRYRASVARLCVLAMADPTVAGQRLCDFIVDWWIQHIQEEDKQYSDFLRSIGVVPC